MSKWVGLVLRNDWTDLLPWKKFNFRVFRLINFEIEYDHIWGQLEVEMVLAGLGLCIYAANPWADARKRLEDSDGQTD